MNIFRSVFCIILILIPLLCIAQEKTSIDHKIDLINKEIEAVLLKENIPAINLAIVLNGNNKYFLNHGHTDRSQEQETDENSIFQIASLGKMFIGIIAQNLILEEKVRINQPITDFLNFKLKKKKKKMLSKITVEQLLHHTSGVPADGKEGYNRKDGYAYTYDYKVSDLEKELNKIHIRSSKNFKYSNFGYALLAYIMEEASGSSYEQMALEAIIQ